MLPSVVAPNAYLAVQDYGQRLGFALGEIALKQEADDRAFLWNCTVGLVADLAPGPWGTAAGVVEGYVAQWLHVDGTWETGGDHGLTFGPNTPNSADLAALTPEEWTVADRVARMAQSSFDGTEQVLGHALPPISAQTHWWGPLLAAVVPGPADLPGLAGRRHPAVSPIR